MKVRVRVWVELAGVANPPGEILELDAETAKASPWAFEEVEPSAVSSVSET